MAEFFARFSRLFGKEKHNFTSLADGGLSFNIGALIDQRYRVEAEIGRGGMGIVYRAYDIPNSREVAIKIINNRTANALALQQFFREAEIASQLRHPHIVAVYGTGVLSADASVPLPYIVMELAQGICLDEVHGLTHARIIDIAKQICDALAYAHDQGFVYRDLKPGNVLLEKRGFEYFVRLLDFGLARPRGEGYLPNESSLAGTVFYLAPELIAGHPADVGSDLYALGAMMYEMITGRVPFSNIDEQTILSQHLEETISPPSHSREAVPPALESIVLRLLEKNPADRFASAKEVFHALEQVGLVKDAISRGNLPQTIFSGSKDEVVRVIQLFESNQLVTLLDDDEPLALAVGGQLIDQFTGGVWLVQLESVTEPGMVLPAVAAVLSVNEDAKRSLTVSLIERLREQNLLLILNHCDHLISACAQFVETLLRTCPEVYILTVSRQPLNVAVERCYRGKENV